MSATRILCLFLMLSGSVSVAQSSPFIEPWRDPSRALVIDAYEFNSINWQELVTDKRIVGFIGKASDGLSEPYRCQGNATERELCRTKWRRYSVTKELYQTRRSLAKALGLKWGAYHLGRPGNPVEQADHFIDFADPSPDELIAIDIENNDPKKWMSLSEAETFARRIHQRLGRYPVLYTNGSTAQYIADHRHRYTLLSRLPLWYARYAPSIKRHFPKGHWARYDLWQFAANVNCTKRRCPYRPPGTPLDIDVNVADMTVEELRTAWPLDGLKSHGDAPPQEAEMMIAKAPVSAATTVAAAGGKIPLPMPAPRGGETHGPVRYVTPLDWTDRQTNANILLAYSALGQSRLESYRQSLLDGFYSKRLVDPVTTASVPTAKKRDDALHPLHRPALQPSSR